MQRSRQSMSPVPPPNAAAPEGPDPYATRWSLILRARPGGPDWEEAIGQLLARYHPAIDGFFRESLKNLDYGDAAASFESLKLPPLVRDANQSKGRFRSLLWTALTRHRDDYLRKVYAGKRGGGVQNVQLDATVAESASVPDDAGGAIHEHFDLSFARATFQGAVDSLREDWIRKGKPENEFDLLVGVDADRPADEVAAKLGIKSGAARTQRSRLLDKLREAFFREVSDMVGSANAQEEATYLIKLLTRYGFRGSSGGEG